MAANELERAVLAAARAVAAIQVPGFTAEAEAKNVLRRAVAELEAWGATQDPTIQEIGWHELTEGDELRSVRNGRYYPVTKVLKVRNGYEISLAGIPKAIIRPTKNEPTATIRRGPTGQAVDTLIHVFSSGG